MLDGVFFAGGNDLNPHLYGQEPHECVTDYSDLRDTTEAKLMKWALEDQKPILAVCRGMQLLNIHYGGTLYQHIPDDLPHAYDHDASNKAKTLVDTSHLLRIEESSQLAKILGAATIGTNEHHHQAINKSGKGIVITAWASDGIIEALELPDHPYAIGIQSHPESLTIVEPRWAKLFASFVEATQS
jgi:putative glutamine amidotransferase